MCFFYACCHDSLMYYFAACVKEQLNTSMHSWYFGAFTHAAVIACIKKCHWRSCLYIECSGEYVNTKLRALSSICLNAYICAFPKELWISHWIVRTAPSKKLNKLGRIGNTMGWNNFLGGFLFSCPCKFPKCFYSLNILWELKSKHQF